MRLASRAENTFKNCSASRVLHAALALGLHLRHLQPRRGVLVLRLELERAAEGGAGAGVLLERLQREQRLQRVERQLEVARERAQPLEPAGRQRRHHPQRRPDLARVCIRPL